MYSTDSPFIDQVNGAYDAEDAALRESSMYYESFIRIPGKNISTALPLLLSMQCAVKSQFWLSPPDSLWHSPTYYFHGMQFEVITPSDEYDFYTRSLYKQKKNYIGKTLIGKDNYYTIYKPLIYDQGPDNWSYGIAVSENIFMPFKRRLLFIFIMISCSIIL